MDSSRTADDNDLSSGLIVTRVGVLANVVLVVLKLSVGITMKSQALVADGVHSVSDLISDMAVYYGLKWGRKAADEDHPYGHGRIETVASFIVGLILFLVAIGIAYSSVTAIYRHESSTPSALAIWVAGLSIVIKEALYWYTVAIGRRINSPAVIANAWHHRSDALSSVAVLIGVAAAYFNPNWHIADSVAALVVSFFILRVALSLLASAVNELVDTTPGPEFISSIRQKAARVEGVLDVHDVKARKSGPHIFAELHIMVDQNMSVLEGHNIAMKVEDLLFDEMDKISKVIIHIDPHKHHDRRL